MLHYHLRPGGVRSVIESTLPAFAARLGVERVVFLTGEAAPDGWSERMAEQLPAGCFSTHIERALGYFSEQRDAPCEIRHRIRSALRDAIPDAASAVVWFHNPGLGRNLLVNRAVATFAARTDARLIFHHHDFWVENRWSRWPEMRQAGCRTLDSVASAMFGVGTRAVHATITSSDARALRLPVVACAPNPQSAITAKSNVRETRRWLTSQLGDDRPVWILPTRILRRKNPAEAALIARWLLPDGWLVAFGGEASAGEQEFIRRLNAAASQNHWRAVFHLRRDHASPSPSALIAASEAVLLTSVQEGFGLAFLEAAVHGKPLIARRLPNVQPDLDALGFEFPHLYDDVIIPSALFDHRTERLRQHQLFLATKSRLPEAFRKHAKPPIFSDKMPFSRLTLDAQLEVLRHPPEQSWTACRPLNPVLNQIAESGLRCTLKSPAFSVSPESTANRLAVLLARRAPELSLRSARRALDLLAKERLASAHRFPILETV